MEEDEEKITPAEFAKIREIVEVFNASSFDYLTLELPGMKLTVGTGSAPVPDPAGATDPGMALPPTAGQRSPGQGPSGRSPAVGTYEGWMTS